MPSGSLCGGPDRSLVRELLWSLFLSAGLVQAQVPGLNSGSGLPLSAGSNAPSIPTCLAAVVTVTVFPPDYTGIFASLTTPGIPLTTLPPLTIPTPDLGITVSGLLPTTLPSAELPLSISTNAPVLGLSSVLSDIGSVIPTNLPVQLSSLLSEVGGALPTTLPSGLSSLLSDIGSALPTAVPSVPLSDIPLTTALPVLPSLVQDVVSALVPTSQLPTQTPVSYSCPADNGQVLVENGLPYVLNCNGASTGEVFGRELASESFNDCFAECDQASVSGLANFCTGFYYAGEPNGDGPGTCYLQNSVAQTFRLARGYISAARLLNYIVGGLEPIPLLDSTSSIVVSIPSGIIVPTGLPTIAIPSVSLELPPLPSGLPLTTALPLSDLTNLVPGLTSAIGGIATNLPSSDLTNVVPGLTSVLGPIIPTPTTSDCGLLGLNCVGTSGLPTNIPLSDLTNLVPGLTSLLGSVLPSDLPLTTALAPLPSALSSILAGLECDVNALLVGLGLSNGSPVVSSILAGPTQSICSLLSGLPTALPSVALPTLSIPLPTNQPTNQPITTAVTPVPSALSSVLAGLPCDVTSLVAALPNGDPAVSSILAGPTTAICSLLSGLPTGLPPLTLPSISLSSGLPLTTAIPTGIPLSSLLPDLGISSITLPSVALPTDLPSISLSLSLPTTISVSIPSLALPTVSNPLTISGLPFPSSSLSLSVPSLSLSVPSIAVPTISSPLSGLPTSIPSISLPLSIPTTLAVSTPSLSISVPAISPLIPGNPVTNLPGTGASSSTIPRLPLPTSTGLSAFDCSADQGLAYVSPSGQAFSIQCNTNYVGSDIASSSQPSLYSCANSCSAVAGCSGITYQAETSLCSYKSSVGSGVPSEVFSGAAPIDLDCPNADGVFYTDFSGATYQILCNVTFPSSTNVTAPLNPNVGVTIGARGETGEEDEEDLTEVYDVGSSPLAARQAAAVSPVVPSIIVCSNRCSNIAGCIAATEQNDQCVFISDLGASAVGSGIADTVVLAGRRVLDTSGFTSTSLVTAIPTRVSSRAASAINNAPTITTTPILPPISIPPIIATPTTSDCGLFGLNCVSGPPAATTNPPVIVPGGSASSSSVRTAATSSDCGLLGLNCVGGNPGGSNPTPAPGTGTSFTQTLTVTPLPASSATGSSTRDCGLLGLNCVGGNSGNPSSTISSLTTVTTRTRTYSQITALIPVTTITTTSTVSYCNVGPNNFTTCSPSLLVAIPTGSSSSSSAAASPTSTTRNCGALGLNCL